MSSITIQPPIDPLDYQQIEAAVKETSRGRWFLEEFARRNRQADTLTVLGAIETLQRSLASRPIAVPIDRLQGEIIEMARAIARTEREMRAMRQANGHGGPQFGSASDELDAVVQTTEQATSSILSAAEKVQEKAWTMREQNNETADCDLLDACATEIYTACGFQDLTAQRIRKVTETLRFLDQRIKSMLEASGLGHEIASEIEDDGPLSPELIGGLKPSDVWMSEAHQAEIDDTFDFFVPAAEVSEPTMIGAEFLEIDEDPSPVKRPSGKNTKPQAIEAQAVEIQETRKQEKSKQETSKKETKKQESKAQTINSQEIKAQEIEAQEIKAQERQVQEIEAYDSLSTEERLRAFR